MQRRLMVVPLVALAAAACSGADSPTNSAPRSMSVAFSTTPSSASPSIIASGANVSPDVVIGSGSDTLVITSAQLVIEHLELRTVDGAACDTTGKAEESDCDELSTGPMLVSLPLTAGASTALDVSVPPGTYRKLSLKVSALETEDDSAAAAFIAAHPDFKGVSIEVQGTFNGVPFTYTTSQEAELEMAFATPVVVDKSGMNVTVNVDVSTWFRTAGGVVIDPATANAGGSNESIVNGNIQASFGAFEDDNHDGHEDHS